jgi:hypothetical protein
MDLEKRLIELTLPEADIGGLHFNETKVHAVFELKENGNYYSRDILFHSARDTDGGIGRDLLSEYLDSEAVKEAFCSALHKRVDRVNIRVFIPEKPQGIKKYNGVTCWYWLRNRYFDSATLFCNVYTAGDVGRSYASVVGGCSPAFRIHEEVV